ncbi:MAG: hypothetical protein IT373_06210 [Polyangiaceae bacterium]|nr:hypothetical protein [Polyangiaceae bacterium]
MRFVLLASVALLAACSTPELKEAELVEMLVKPTSGVLGGFALGDSWSKLKAEHDPRYSVRDDTFKQLRRDLGSPGEEGFFVGFTLDGDTVQSIDASIYGSKANTAVVRQALDVLGAHFVARVGPGECVPTGPKGQPVCHWASKDGKIEAEASFLLMDDPPPLTADLSVRVGPGTSK